MKVLEGREIIILVVILLRHLEKILNLALILAKFCQVSGLRFFNNTPSVISLLPAGLDWTATLVIPIFYIYRLESRIAGRLFE